MKWPWKVTADYGAVDSAHKTPHIGVDMAAPLDSKVHAFSEGVVDHISRDGKHDFGNAVWIREPDGYKIVYGHLDKVKAYAGERIRKDDVIGLSGSTGESTGPHLHVGVMDPSGKWVNPDEYFSPLHNWLHLSSNRLKNAETDALTGKIEHIIENVVSGLFQDFGEWALHQIAPVAFIICAVSFLGVIVSIVRARKWAFYSGLLATIGYHMGWSS